MLISCLVDFIGLVGWRLVPARSQTDPEGFDTGSYLTEARVTEDNKAAGMRLREIEAALDEAEAETLATAPSSLGLALKAARHKAEKEQPDGHAAPSDEYLLVELVILPASGLVGRTPSDIQLRGRFASICLPCRARADAAGPGCAPTASRSATC